MRERLSFSKKMENHVGAVWYFIHDYNAQQSKGLSRYHYYRITTNEHTNGLLRQFFPKETNLKILKPEEVERAVNLINNRPRKCLDYRTPNEVFYGGRSDSDAIQT